MESEKSSGGRNLWMALLPSRRSVHLYIQLIAWVLVVYAISTFFPVLSTVISLSAIIYLSIVYLTLTIIFDTNARAINFFYKKKNGFSPEHVDSFMLGTRRLSRAAHYFIFALFLIDLFIPIKTVFGSITIAIAVVGLAFRDTVTNFMNGVNIMFSGRFQLGEYVRIGDIKGKIKDLTFTHVHLQTESQDVVFVPNNLLLAKEVVNFSKNKKKNVFVHMYIDKGNYARYRELQQRITQGVLGAFPNDIAGSNGINFRVDALDKDGIGWMIEFDVSRYDFELEIALKNYVAEIAVDFFAQGQEPTAQPASPSKPSARPRRATRLAAAQEV